MSQGWEEVFEGELLGAEEDLTLEQLCLRCEAEAQQIHDLVQEGVLALASPALPWRFAAGSLARARIAMRLQRDLEINLAGVALVLQLLDELRRLRGERGPE